MATLDTALSGGRPLSGVTCTPLCNLPPTASHPPGSLPEPVWPPCCSSSVPELVLLQGFAVAFPLPDQLSPRYPDGWLLLLS